MSDNSSEEDAAVKRHDSQHYDVAQAGTNGMHGRLKEPSGHLVGLRLNDGAIREAFNHHGQAKYEEQSECIHAAAGTGPTREEDLGFVAPIGARVRG
ncbi:hypothetical protein F3Y22_tig00110053pilonHSYRG00020 [Hibiscus syriacus]|uniref:Uncharacterized protein n=1 Tax=Hibiscus syriacus TaxID=106335 RepID=A0A6A3BQX2_HIBSY|nr:hypothetical protein F3Y22_tig00110053pilonHSYRG00020 [Hibiscus syriacus]